MSVCSSTRGGTLKNLRLRKISLDSMDSRSSKKKLSGKCMNISQTNEFGPWRLVFSSIQTYSHFNFHWLEVMFVIGLIKDILWGNNFYIKLDLREIGIDGAKFIRLAQDRIKLPAFVNTVMNFLVPCLTSWVTITFSKNILHHGVSNNFCVRWSFIYL
jgi:hypothetical protein